MNSKKSKSSHRWLIEHAQDKYVQEAKRRKIRSRAWFKLAQIDHSSKLFQLGMNIIDLGASPGSWSQYALSRIGRNGRVIACDILPMKPIKGIHFIQGDFRNDLTIHTLLKDLRNTKIHMLMSDMAPNMTGHAAIDMPQSIFLSKLALKIANNILLKNGIFLVKSFQGEGFNEFYKEITMSFSKVKMCKPKTSRTRSREIFVLATR